MDRAVEGRQFTSGLDQTGITTRCVDSILVRPKGRRTRMRIRITSADANRTRIGRESVCGELPSPEAERLSPGTRRSP